MKPNGLSALLADLFATWRRERIQYLVLRNYEKLPEYTDNDIDILIAPQDLRVVLRILDEVAVREEWTIHNTGHFACFSVYLFHRTTLQQVHIDFMCGIKWHSLVFADHAAMLASRTPFKDFFVPMPAHEAAVSLMTRLLYGGYVHQKYRQKIQETAQAHRTEFHATLAPWLGRSLAGRFVELSSCGQWGEIERATRKARLGVLRANFRQPVGALRQLLADVIRVTRRWRTPPGISVVLIGPDGCGKTTVAEGLSEALGGTFSPKRTLHCHWKPSRPRKGGSPPTIDPHGKPQRNLLGSLCFFTYHYAAFLVGWWIHVQPVLFKNGLVLIDRYYYDFFVDQRRYRLKLPAWLIRAGFNFIRKPDLVFCLDAPVAVLQARKTEVSSAECERQSLAYRLLVQGLPNGTVIDAARPPRVVVEEVQRAVLRYMADRCRGLGTGAQGLKYSDTPSPRQQEEV